MCQFIYLFILLVCFNYLAEGLVAQTHVFSVCVPGLGSWRFRIRVGPGGGAAGVPFLSFRWDRGDNI